MQIPTFRWSKVFTAALSTLPIMAVACSKADAPPSPTLQVENAPVIEPTEFIEPTAAVEEIEQSPTVLPSPMSPRVGEQDLDRTYCDGAEKTHPVGESIARTYDVPYKDLIDIYCEGFEFEEILLALETEVQTGTGFMEILKMRDNGYSWDDVWEVLEIYD